MFLQNNTTTTHKMSHKHFHSVLAQRFASVFILLYFTYNEQSTNKIFKANALKRYLQIYLIKCKKIVQIA